MTFSRFDTVDPSSVDRRSVENAKKTKEINQNWREIYDKYQWKIRRLFLQNRRCFEGLLIVLAIWRLTAISVSNGLSTLEINEKCQWRHSTGSLAQYKWTCMIRVNHLSNLWLLAKGTGETERRYRTFSRFDTVYQLPINDEYLCCLNYVQAIGPVSLVTISLCVWAIT